MAGIDSNGSFEQGLCPEVELEKSAWQSQGRTAFRTTNTSINEQKFLPPAHNDFVTLNPLSNSHAVYEPQGPTPLSSHQGTGLDVSVVSATASRKQYVDEAIDTDLWGEGQELIRCL
jgi:hypothetical protein